MDYSGVRLEEQHGSYCDVSRNTIRLTPEGLLRNCFCVFDDKEAFITGRYNKEESAFEIRSDVKDLKRRALSFPDECTQCINIFHCSRGCPDFCIFQTDGNQKLNPFRCRLHQIITVEKLKELVDANGFKNE